MDLWKIEALSRALADQQWAALGDALADIQRVFLSGAGPGDAELVRRVFGVVGAELYRRRAARGDEDNAAG